jgi:hypothetical protein
MFLRKRLLLEVLKACGKAYACGTALCGTTADISDPVRKRE